MRRSAVAAILSLLLVALVGSSVSAARPDATFGARANHAQQGGALKIVAKVKHPVKRTAFSATAVVHFATGDVSIELRRAGRSFVARARVPVAVDAALGPVSIDVTINYGETIQMLLIEGVIVAPEVDELDDDGGEDEG